MVELSRSSSVLFLLSALLVLDLLLGETFLGLFLFSLTTLSRSLTHTHTLHTHSLQVCSGSRAKLRLAQTVWRRWLAKRGSALI